MYYKFDGITQKLAGATARSAYFPQGLNPSIPPDPAPLVFAGPIRPAPDHGSRPESSFLGRNKVPHLQKLFQRPDGLPVHLKGGYADKLLYRITMALAVGGTIYSLVALYLAAQPQTKK
ncbi:cytochrome c oxidase subunit 7A-related protein, mitochondrial-like [Ambystoma mexicanum]|uniref:cytochrome c oxidase subunit 7A-related protein, mitochondrial-like n=1 Tax=Ambystoma mexicanum TaxID=8296 RepID=UPI0037E94391